MSLSSSWAPAIRSATSAEQRLALAIGPVRSIVRVIDTHSPAFPVDWAAYTYDDKGRQMSKSYTDFGNGRIAINPLPILHGMDLGEAIDVCAGFGLHEASHAEESRDRYTDLLDKEEAGIEHGRPVYREKPAFRPFRVAIWLWNLVEDVRIEDCTGRKWPGSKPYFRKVLDWMWKQHPPVIDDFASSKIEDRMKVVFVACRYPEKLAGLRAVTALVSETGPRVEGLLDDPERQAEIAFWQAWQADYLAGRADVRETIQRGLDHLALDDVTAQEMAGMSIKEKMEEDAGEKARAQLDRLLREGLGTTPVCITEDGEVVPLTAEQAEVVNQLVREQLRSEKPLFTDNDNRCAEVRITRPTETAESRKAFIGKPTPLVEALRAALVFRADRPEFDVKLQKTGHLDEQELWRLQAGDYRVFSEHVVEARHDVALGILVDMSGSMAGPHLRTAQRLAQTALWTVMDDEGVEARVWGHTGDLGAEGSDIYRLWEPGDPASRLGLISTLPHGDNYDGFAIAHCVSQMKEMPQPTKVLIVLSDGYPAGRDYGGSPAQQHMRHVCDWAERQGVAVFQIAIDHELRAADQEAMFGPGRWLSYSTDARLPRDLARLIARVTQ